MNLPRNQSPYLQEPAQEASLLQMRFTRSQGINSLVGPVVDSLLPGQGAWDRIGSQMKNGIETKKEQEQKIVTNMEDINQAISAIIFNNHGLLLLLSRFSCVRL